MTLPDQCMSVSEIFRRFALGQNLETAEMRTPVYGDVMEDYEFDELHEMLPKKPVEQVYSPEDYSDSESKEKGVSDCAPQSESEETEPDAKELADEQ